MTERYEMGLVVGKFAPLHAGHMLTIGAARAKCKSLILISYSNPELPDCDPTLREMWLRECFPDATILVVTNQRLQEWFSGQGIPEIPGNDASDFEQREFVAMLCSRILRRNVDAVFTSESYGDGFAKHLTRYFQARDPNAKAVAHVRVDEARAKYPISGTALRRNPWRHWEYLPAPVARSWVRRVAFVGGESSGKTTLAAHLAGKLLTQWVPEYGRELWELRRGQLVYEDLSLIAREQIRREKEAAQSARAFLFCDTSPLTTLFYSLEMFGRAEPELQQASLRDYFLVVLCAPDFPFVQDGTRRGSEFRQQQHDWYVHQLQSRDVPYVIASGSIEDRCRQIGSALHV